MTRMIRQLLFAGLLVAPVIAGAPRKPMLPSYSMLWTQSPFTTKPVVETTAVAEANPFEDWALGGVSSVSGRKMVWLFHRKEAGRKMVIDSGDKSGEFQVVEVRQQDDYKMTEVVITSGGRRGTVTYDDKLMSTRLAVAAKAQAQAQAKARAQGAKAPPGVTPGGQARPPRMRVIPQPKGGNTGQRPTPQQTRPPGTSGHRTRR